MKYGKQTKTQKEKNKEIYAIQKNIRIKNKLFSYGKIHKNITTETTIKEIKKYNLMDKIKQYEKTKDLVTTTKDKQQKQTENIKKLHLGKQKAKIEREQQNENIQQLNKQFLTTTKE